MAVFDFTRATRQGYALAWKCRAQVARLALPALAAHMLCTLAVTLGGLGGGSILGQTVMFLPALFAQGWMAASAARLAVGAPMRGVQADRARLAGMALFVLTVMADKGAFALLHPMLPAHGEAPPPPAAAPGLLDLLILMALLGAMLWAVRLFWLFIPAAMGVPLGRYIIGLGGLLGSACIVAVWIAGFAPFALLGLGLAQLGVGMAAAGVLKIAALAVTSMALARGLAALLCGPGGRDIQGPS